MKKLLLISIVIIMILCSSCGTIDDDTKADIKDDVYDIYESLRSDWKDADSIDEITDPLVKWANENDISCSRLTDGNMIFSLDATDDYTQAQQTMIQCSLGLTYKKSRAECAAIAMAALKNVDEHGKVKLLFTSDMSKMEKKQLKTDNFIGLIYCKNTQLYTGSAASCTYDFTQKLHKQKTKGDVSYRISLTDFEGGDSADRTKKHANPIKGLGTLLKSCQSAGLAFELSSFTGGSSKNTLPQYAYITITVDKNDEDKLIERIKQAKESFDDKNRKKDNSYSYIYEKVKTPKNVYSDDDTSNIISFLYTVDDGAIEAEDDNDDKAMTISNICMITSNGKLDITMKAHSIEPSKFNDLFEIYKNTGELSDFTVNKTDIHPAWAYKESSELCDRYEVAARQAGLHLEPTWTYSETDCATVYEKRQDQDMICIGANIQDGFDLAQSLVSYLQSLKGEQ